MSRTPDLAIHNFQLRQFKAVRESGMVRFTPLTVFIGNNGSGKSSLIEGLQTLKNIVVGGLDSAMRPWRGFEHIWHKGSQHKLQAHGSRPQAFTNPMRFTIRGGLGSKKTVLDVKVNLRNNANDLAITAETITSPLFGRFERSENGQVKPLLPGAALALSDGESLLSRVPDIARQIADWQFVLLDPALMGKPVAQSRTRGRVRLAEDGANIAEYLLDIYTRDPVAFEGIIEALQYVLPYAADLQPVITSELERAVYLNLTENEFKVPGWLFSTGTLRVLGILALLRDPEPPALLVIEEIENGLDPRTVRFIIDEIRSALLLGQTQVIITTHSPYLLDLLDLSHIVVVERGAAGPVFRRPATEENLQYWADEFAPGQLYTMGRLNNAPSEQAIDDSPEIAY